MAEIMVRSDDLELAAEAFGNPLDAALLLIMGVGGSMLLWPAAFCEKLASRGFYVLRYDNRDTGRSTFWPPGAPDLHVDLELKHSGAIAKNDLSDLPDQ